MSEIDQLKDQLAAITMMLQQQQDLYAQEIANLKNLSRPSKQK